MSTVWWAGVGFDTENQDEDMRAYLNAQVDDMLAALGAFPIVCIRELDGSERWRYQFGDYVITDLISHGARVGFGIETCGEEEAKGELVRMQTALNRWGADVLASVWVWEQMRPASSPVPIEVQSAIG
jgi:hypothetical protein